MKGWIKLHRSLLECDLWLEEEAFDKRSAWIDLLLRANHSDKELIFDGKPMIVKRGQLVTSIRKLSVRWMWGKNKTVGFLDELEAYGMIKRHSDSRRTLLTIVNYEVYQGDADSIGTVTDTVTGHKQTTNKKEKNVKKEINSKSKIAFRNFDMKHEYNYEDMEKELLG